MSGSEPFDSTELQSIRSLARFPEEDPSPVMRVRVDGVLTYANKPGAPILRAWGVEFDEKVPPHIEEELKAVVEEGSPREIEVTVEGRTYWLMLSPIIEAGYLNIYGRDVTERKQIEGQILDLARFPDEDPNPVMRVSETGTILYANAPSRPVLEAWARHLGGDVPHEIAQVIRDALSRRKSWHVEVRSGDRVYELEVAPISGTGYINIYGRDVTRQKRAEADLIRARDDALEASRAKGDFLANMSHELRTPMNAIIGYSEMLLEDARDHGVERFTEDLDKIHSAARHLLGLINSVLDLSKIEAGRVDVFVEETSIEPLVRDVVDTARPLIMKNGNELLVDCPPGLPALRTDVTKLRQVLFNLLSNAAKFTSSGAVTLRVRAEPDRGGGNLLRFDVEDTGIGMNEAERARVFEPFVQADTSTTRRYGGTGLGLTITRHFCEILGGTIEVESEVGKGTVFRVRIPARIPTGAQSLGVSDLAAKVGAAAERSGVDGGVVLVVDDDPAVQEILCSTLTKAGFDVISAGSGVQGLELARKHRPLAITLDVIMQDMDGWRVLTELKDHDETRHIPVILATISDDRALGFALGAADFMTKPIDRARLVQLLERYREGPGSEVMVVEDDEDTRQMLVRLVEKAGFRAVEAENGFAALERLEISKPELVILDLVMPVMDGFRFIDVLRQDARFEELPVLVITAKELTPEERQVLQGGVSRVFQKGRYDRDEFLEAVHTMVSRSVQP